MKQFKLSLFSLLLILSVQQGWAQTSKGFHYQAVARDNAGDILANTSVTLRFQVHQGSPTGTIIYQEVHNLTTNNFGLVQTIIGKGTVEAGDFSTIDWIADDYYLAVQLNGNAIDNSLLEAVPYAKTATDMTLGDLNNVAQISPAAGQVLKWSGSAWEPQDLIEYTAGAGVDITNGTISNTEPDQVVQITGSGATKVTGSYPNFNVFSTDEVDDSDANPTNEIQSLSLSGNTLSLSLGGGSANLLPFAPLWQTNGSNLYYNSGNVGIGDNTPINTFTVGNGDKFQVRGADGDVRMTDDQGTLQFARTTDPNNTPMIEMFPSGTNNSARMLFAHSPAFRDWGLLYNDTLDAFTWLGSGDPALHLQLAGQQRIGVGTDEPESKLQVVFNSSDGLGQLKLTETESDFSRLTFDNTGNNSYWQLEARTLDGSLSSSDLNFFHSDGGTILAMDGRGHVGIGDGTPSYALEVNGDGGTRSINVYNSLPTTTSTTNNYGVICNLSQVANTGFPRLYNIYGFSTDSDAYISYGSYGRATNASNFNYGVYGVASTTSGYAVYASGNTYTTGSYLPSDARLKSGVRNFREGLAGIMQLQPRMYTYNTREYDFMNLPEGRQFGFLAQEFEEVFPQFTKRSFQAFDEPLSDTPEGQGIEFKTINYTALIPVMVSAIQEQQGTIEKQQEQIESLEARLAALEAIIGSK